jgi:hypothetical protein
VSRWVRPLLVLTGLAVVAYLVAQIGPAAIWSSFVTLGWRLPLVLAFPYALAALVDTIAWRLLLPGPVPLSLVFRARLAGEAVNLATPTMAVGGEPVKALLLRPRVSLLDGLVSVIADKTTIVVGQIIFLAGGLLAARTALPPSSRLVPIMTGLLAVEILAIGGFALVQASGGLGGGGCSARSARGWAWAASATCRGWAISTGRSPGSIATGAAASWPRPWSTRSRGPPAGSRSTSSSPWWGRRSRSGPR